MINREKFKVHIDLIAREMEACSIRCNGEEILDMMDAKEYLRRAWLVMDGTPIISNDTQSEIAARKNL